jgi:hypothetical protein
VDGITKAANDRSYQRTEKQQKAPKATFRGCGQNSKSSQSILNVLVPSNHSPEKQRIAPKVVFGAVAGNPKATNQYPEKQRIASKAHFRGCGRNSKSIQ